MAERRNSLEELSGRPARTGCRGIDRETVAEPFVFREVDVHLIAETKRRFRDRDAADYGNRPIASLTSTRSLVRRLHKATVRYCWCAAYGLRCVAMRQKTPMSYSLAPCKCARSNPMRTTALGESALGFEAAERFSQWGQAWF